MSDIFNFPAIAEKLDLSVYTDRQKIEIIEWYMLKTMDNIADELPFNEYVHGGIYERELFIPKDTILTGKIHLADHIFYLLKGDLSVMTDNGVKRIQAPARFDVKSGIKKIGYAHEDCLCTTFHKTHLTDLDEIEKELFEDSDLTWVDNMIKLEVLV
jgi:hypothetical protein